MYRWVNIFARPVPIYALVDGYVGVCVYVFMRLSMYVAVAVHIYVHISTCSSIYPYIYAPEQKIEIENRDHP